LYFFIVGMLVLKCCISEGGGYAQRVRATSGIQRSGNFPTSRCIKRMPLIDHLSPCGTSSHGNKEI